MWDRGLTALHTYQAEHGHACPRTNHVTPDGFRLGGWINARRTDHANNRLSAERTTQLEALPGWQWHTFDTRWDHGFQALRAFQQHHGHTRPTTTHTTPHGFRLGRWVDARRTAYKRGRLSPERITMLEALPGWTWDASPNPRP
ncbi:helicase associated domain-containing protein [Streptacidiphilus sp. EB129]|uniref:helicase associated domain-containing protein n=1 Tax=Streptacidiphilus sp. EB129 TaxID=3156262 RepID=UPI0035180744